jgi:hypothetical protein
MLIDYYKRKWKDGYSTDFQEYDSNYIHISNTSIQIEILIGT